MSNRGAARVSSGVQQCGTGSPLESDTRHPGWSNNNHRVGPDNWPQAGDTPCVSGMHEARAEGALSTVQVAAVRGGLSRLGFEPLDRVRRPRPR